MKTCCICGQDADTDNGLYINGATAPICSDCENLLDRLETFSKNNPQREKIYQILKNKMKSNNSSVNVIEAVNEIYQPGEPIEFESDSTDSDNQENDEESYSTDSDNQENDEESYSLFEKWKQESRFSTASGENLPYVVMQVTLKEKLLGTGSRNLTDLERVINAQVAKGYRLHTMSTANSDSKGFGLGDRIQATLVFERMDITR